jgi:hypothetical protein
MKTLTELMELADDLTEICVDSASAESVEELTEYIKRIREAKTALQTALAELIAENERLTKEAMYGAEFTHSDDAMFERIERAARASFNRHRRATRGQQCTRADAYETHLVWATQQEVKAERDAAIAERDELKARLKTQRWGGSEELVVRLRNTPNWDDYTLMMTEKEIDAARYQWLKSTAVSDDDSPCIRMQESGKLLTGDEADSAMDAAMKGTS